MGASGSQGDAPPDRDAPRFESLSCSRCGGSVVARGPRRHDNPFLPRPPLHVVCLDCGLEFDVQEGGARDSGDPPW